MQNGNYESYFVMLFDVTQFLFSVFNMQIWRLLVN